MKKTDLTTYRVATANGQLKDYSESDYIQKNLPGFLEKEYPGQYTVFKLETVSNTAPNAIQDDVDYLMSVPNPDGTTSSKVYTGKDLKDRNLLDDYFNKHFLGRYNMQKIRAYDNADIAFRGDALEAKAWMDQSALDAFDAENGVFMDDYRQKQRAYDTGARSYGSWDDPNFVKTADYVVTRRTDYDDLVKERRRLQYEYESNPLVQSAYKQEAKQAQAAADLNLEKENAASGQDYNNYKHARKFDLDAAQLYSLPIRSLDDSIDKDFWKGMGKGISDVFADRDFWTLGMTEIARNVGVSKIFEDLKERGLDISEMSEQDFDNALTDSQKSLLFSFVRYSEAAAQRSGSMPKGYSAGQTAAESAGFMAQFFITGGVGSAIAKGVGKTATKAVVKGTASGLAKFLSRATNGSVRGMVEQSVKRNMVKDMTANGAKYLTKDMKPLINVASKTAGSLYEYGAKPLARSVARTPFMMSTYVTASEDLLQRAQSPEEVGSIGSAFLQSVWNSLPDQIIENWSEDMGLAIGAFGGSIKRGVGKALGATVGKINVGEITLGQWGKWVADSYANKVLLQAGFNGLVGEMAEEWVGNAARVAVGIMDKEDFKEFADPRQQLEMAISFAPMSLLGLGSTSVAAAKQAKEYKSSVEEMRGVLNRAGMTKDEIANILDAQHTKQEIADALTPVLNKIISNASTENGQQTSIDDYEATLRFAQNIAASEVMDAAKEVYQQEYRNRIREQISNELGATSMEDPRGKFSYEIPMDGGNSMEVVTIVKDAEGKEYYNVGTQGTQVALKKANGGDIVFIEQKDYEEKIVSGELQANTQSASSFLDSRVSNEKEIAEKESRDNQLVEARKKIINTYKTNPQIDLGTKDSPKVGTVTGFLADGVIVEFDKQTEVNGVAKTVHKISYEQAGNAIGVDSVYRSDEEKAQDEVDNVVRRQKEVRTYNKQFKGLKFTSDGKTYEYIRMVDAPFTNETGVEMVKVSALDGDAVSEVTMPLSDLKDRLDEQKTAQLQADQDKADIEASKQDDGTPKDFRGNALPMKSNDNGELVVDTDALWNKDPEAYLRWNDNQRGGNTEDSQELLSATIIKEQAQKDALLDAKSAETVPSARQAFDKQIIDVDNRINLYSAILHKYQAEENYKQKQLEYANALADIKRRMLDAKTQERYDELKKAETELTRKYLNETIDGSYNLQLAQLCAELQQELNKMADMPVTMVTYANVESTMREKGASEEAINSVLQKISAVNRENLASGRHYVIKGCHNNGIVYIFAEGNADLQSATQSYYHERQHEIDAKGDTEVVDEILALADNDADALYKTLETIIGEGAVSNYKGSIARVLADEIVAFTIQEAYTNNDYIQVLKDLGLTDNLITIISKEYGRQTGKEDSVSERSGDGNRDEHRSGQGATKSNEQVDGGKSTDEQLGSVRQGEPSEQGKEIGDYKLSNEVDENGRQFVLNSEGDIKFGEITVETGLTPAPIQLSEGIITNPSTKDGYGLVHIEARHGEQIRKAGYKSVVDFVESVAQNYEIIRKGIVRDGIQTYMLQLTDKHNNTLMVELSGDGSYWNINTAGIFKKTYGANREEVYNRHTTEKQTTESVKESQSEPQSGTESPSSMNSSTPSKSKGINNNQENKVQGLENYTREQIKELVRGHIEEVLTDSGIDIEVLGIEIHGSRNRSDARRDSDLDVVVEYKGDVKEDGLFNILNSEDEPFVIEGIRVDINPIRAEESGTLSDYMKRSEEYDAQLVESRQRKSKENADRAEAKRKQRLLSEPIRMDKDFGLIPVKDIKSSADIISNIEKIVSTLADNEKGITNLDHPLSNYGGYISEHRFLFNAQKQVEQYVRSLDVVDSKIIDEWKSATGIDNVEKLDDYVKGLYEAKQNNGASIAKSSYEKREWTSAADISQMQKREAYLEKALIKGSPESKKVFPEEDAYRLEKKELARMSSEMEDDELKKAVVEFNNKYRKYQERIHSVHEEISNLNDSIISAQQKKEQTEGAEKKKKLSEDKDNRYNGFLAGKTNLSATNADKVLSKKAVFGNKELTNAEFVESHWKDGSLQFKETSVQPYPARWNQMTEREQNQYLETHKPQTGYIVNGFVVNKTVYDYAVFLSKANESKEDFRKYTERRAREMGFDERIDEVVSTEKDYNGEIHGYGKNQDIQAVRSKDGRVFYRVFIKGREDGQFAKEGLLEEAGYHLNPFSRTSDMNEHLEFDTYDEAEAFDKQVASGKFQTKKSVKETKSNNTSQLKAESPREYIYRLNVRPFGVGNQPDGGRQIDDGSKFGAVAYDKPLSVDDIKHYTLTAITDAKQLEGKTFSVPFGKYKLLYNIESVDENGNITYTMKSTREGAVESAPQTSTYTELKEKFNGKETEVKQSADNETNKEPISDQKVDSFGNPLNDDGTLKLESVQSIAELTDEDFTKPTRNVQLPAIPKNIDEAIGADGKPVIIKKNIFERNAVRHSDLTPSQSREIIKSALYNTILYGQNQKTRRPYNWVVINTKDERGKNRIILLEVNPTKDNIEIVHWHYVDERGLEKIKRQTQREDGQLLILPSDTTEEAGALSSPTPGLSSGSKVKQSSETIQTSKGKNRAPRIKKVNPFDFAIKEKNTQRPIFKGVYHDKGMLVATDTAILIAIKDNYPEEFEGAVTFKDRHVTHDVRWPDWRAVFDKKITGKQTKVDIALDKLASYLDQIKSDVPKKILSDEDAGASYVVIDFGDGVFSAYNYERLVKFVDAARYLNAQVSYCSSGGNAWNSLNKKLIAESVNGKVALFPVQIGDEKGHKFNYNVPLNEGGDTRFSIAELSSEELSSATSQKDAEYFAALERGDMETAQRIVNEAAEIAGYTANSNYQGTSAFNGAAPYGNPYFFTKEERKDAWDNDEFEGDQTLGDYIERGIDANSLDFIALDPRNYRVADSMRKEAIDNVRNAIQKRSKTITMFRSVPSNVKEGSFRNGDWVTPSRAYAVDNAKIHGWGDNYNIIKQTVSVDEIWWDGNDIAEWGYGREADYVNDTDFAYKNTKNNRKLLDVITRDDKGNIIPPSQRFDSAKADTRYSIAEKKLSNDNEAKQLAFDATMTMLSDAGIPVEMLSDEAMRQMAETTNALETASVQNGHQPTVVSSASGANVIKEIDNLIEEIQNVSNYPKTILGDIAKALGAKKQGSNSQYATFEAKNGTIVTIRLSNHNAATSTFDNHGEDNGISIVISARENTNISNDGKAHVTEFYYDAIKLRKAEGKPLAEIVKSIKQVLYSGEYKDTTGLAQIEEVNAESLPEFMTVYHGSGAKFDRFDHSHMGEGEGAQAYGWGTYVTEVEGIGRTYAEASLGKGNDLIRRYVGYIKKDMSNGLSFEEAKNNLIERLGGIFEKQTDESLYSNFRRTFEWLKSLSESDLPARNLYTIEIPEDINSRLTVDELCSAIGFLGESLFDGYGLNELQIRALYNTTLQWYEFNRTATNDFFPAREAFKTYGIDTEAVDKSIRDKAMERRRKNSEEFGNYLSFAEDIPSQEVRKIYNALYSALVSDEESGYSDAYSSRSLRKELDSLMDEQFDGKHLYGTISSYLGSDKEASQFLHSLGYVGISYPAEFRTGGRSDGARNYVIFDENDAKIIDRIEFLRNGDVVYGAAVGGKILLNADRLNPNTPIHEYTHLWDKACQKKNPELWKRGVELMKQTSLWKEVESDLNYSGMDERAIASEVHARLTGENGASILENMSKKVLDSNERDILVKIKKLAVIEELKDWVREFWSWIKDTMTGWTKEEASRVSLDDFINMPIADLAKGVNLFNARSKYNEPTLFDNNTQNDSVRFSIGEDETAQIIERAKADGTYMKAPNGKPSNLNERQWAQVRTSAFKNWFGDWEKATRIEKLRESEPIQFTFNNGYPLDRKSAKEWMKSNIKGTYVNKQTGEEIQITNIGINEVASHGSMDEAHLKSLSAIPSMIENSIFIDEIPNVKGNDKYDSYRYYVCGIVINGQEYTAKIVIGVKGDSKYYDHRLSNITKGSLIDTLNRLSNSVDVTKEPSLFDVKDTKLLSILQTDSSKIVDENGEPLVVYHGGPYRFYSFDKSKLGRSTKAASARKGFFFTDSEGLANLFARGSAYGRFNEEELLNYLKRELSAKSNEEVDQIFDRYKEYDQKYEDYLDETDKPSDYDFLKGYDFNYISVDAKKESEHVLKINYILESIDNKIRTGWLDSGMAVSKELSRMNIEWAHTEAVFLKLKNPIIDNIERDYVNEGERVHPMTPVIDQAKDLGRDGVVFTSIHEEGRTQKENQYVVFEPNQIKTAVDNNGEFSSANDDIRFSIGEELNTANAKFNEELDRYQKGRMSPNDILHLGNPQGVMQLFLPNIPIIMRQRVIRKWSEKKHNVDVSAIMNMPQYLSSPILVFQRSNDTIGVLTDMKDHYGKNVCVAIELKHQIQQGAEFLEVNDVRSFHGREFKNIVEPIVNNTTLKWVNKEKGLAYLSSALQPVQQEIDKQVLSLATNLDKISRF